MMSVTTLSLHYSRANTIARAALSLSDSADAQALWRTRPESLKPAGGIILCSLRQIAAHFFFEFVTFKLIVWDI